jgi:cysteine desulfurase/selenocysteine lyase
MSNVVTNLRSVSTTVVDLGVRADFPILFLPHSSGHPLVYLDNGATTQKPQPVIDAISSFYEHTNANIHRGVYELSQKATAVYEQTREKVQRFINARHSAEIIYTRGTTEGINLVAASYGRAFLKPGDEVVVSAMEHHSNIVPWQMACAATGAKLRVIPMSDAGELLLDEYEEILAGGRVRIVAVVHLSNSLGTINDVKTITQLAHAAGAVVLVDGAQWVAHGPTNVQDIGCDFYAFSGHKLFGPTGIGVLYGRREVLEKMSPYQGGGDMIESVTFEKTIYAQIPSKFEAGTPDIAGVVGLGVAVDYVSRVGFEKIVPHEESLLRYATAQMKDISGLRLIGTAPKKGSVISFVLEDPKLSTYEIGHALDRLGVAVRTGHHCCQPVMDRFAIGSTARASLAMYNTKEDVDALVSALKKTVAAARAAHSTHSAARETSMVSLTDLRWPEPAATSPCEAADALVEDFEFLDDWTQRDTYVVEMGDKIPPMPEALKTEANRVHGCMSLVHMVARQRPDTTDGLDFIATSDAPLVRGLIAILQRVYAGQSARQIMAFDIEAFLRTLGLDQHLSLGRRNGLEGMIRRIRAEALRLMQPASPPAVES